MKPLPISQIHGHLSIVKGESEKRLLCLETNIPKPRSVKYFDWSSSYVNVSYGFTYLYEKSSSSHPFMTLYAIQDLPGRHEAFKKMTQQLELVTSYLEVNLHRTLSTCLFDWTQGTNDQLTAEQHATWYMTKTPAVLKALFPDRAKHLDMFLSDAKVCNTNLKRLALRLREVASIKEPDLF